MGAFAEKSKQSQQTRSTVYSTHRHAHFGQRHEVKPIKYAIGYQDGQQLLQTKTDGLEAISGVRAPSCRSYNHSRIPLHTNTQARIQPRLRVNTSGDIHEQEAEHISEQILHMPEPQLQHPCPCGGGCPKCQTNQLGQQYEGLQTKRSQADYSEDIAAPSIVHEVLAEPGQPLDSINRGFMEPRFGYDFGEVRVHTGEKAAASARAVNALAYTVGHDIVFGAGQYALETTAGRQLLAHELVHVVQQDQCVVRNNTPFGSLQRQAPPAQPFDWETAVKQAENDAMNPNTKANAEVTYKDLVVRAAANVEAAKPLVDRKPTVADIQWDWRIDPQHPHGAVMDGKRVDNDPNDYWKWIKFMPGAVMQSGQISTEEYILHELDHASHAKTIYDNWLAAGSPGGNWDAYWLAHIERWAEPAIETEGGIFKGIAGLPETIRPSAIEFRAYATDLMHNFHRVDRSRQAYLATAIVVFYPLQIQAVEGELINDPSLDLRKISLQLKLYYSKGGGHNQPSIIKTLLAYEMHSALLYRPSEDREKIKNELSLIFNTQPSSEEMRAATANYIPGP